MTVFELFPRRPTVRVIPSMTRETHLAVYVCVIATCALRSTGAPLGELVGVRDEDKQEGVRMGLPVAMIWPLSRFLQVQLGSRSVVSNFMRDSK